MRPNQTAPPSKSDGGLPPSFEGLVSPKALQKAPSLAGAGLGPPVRHWEGVRVAVRPVLRGPLKLFFQTLRLALRNTGVRHVTSRHATLRSVPFRYVTLHYECPPQILILHRKMHNPVT